MQLSFSFVSAQAKAELDALPADVRASFERIVQLVQSVGLERVHEPYIKRPRGPSPPMRVTLPDALKSTA